MVLDLSHNLISHLDVAELPEGLRFIQVSPPPSSCDCTQHTLSSKIASCKIQCACESRNAFLQSHGCALLIAAHGLGKTVLVMHHLSLEQPGNLASMGQFCRLMRALVRGSTPNKRH